MSLEDLAFLAGIGIKFKGHGFGQNFTQINMPCSMISTSSSAVGLPARGDRK